MSSFQASPDVRQSQGPMILYGSKGSEIGYLPSQVEGLMVVKNGKA